MPTIISTDLLPATVGVEIEFNSANLELLKMTTDQLGWKLMRDGSCGYELVSPILRTFEDLNQIDQICIAMWHCGATMDSRCGLHVHIGMQDIKDLAAKYRLFRFCEHYENVFFALAPMSRQSNRFAQRLSSTIAQGMKSGKGWKAWNAEAQSHYQWSDRYHWVNGTNMSNTAVSGKKTIEFRLMESTRDSRYIKGWVATLLCVIDATHKGKRKVEWGHADKTELDSFLKDAMITSEKRLGDLADLAYAFITENYNGNRR